MQTILEVIKGDITTIHADAIVNAANNSLLGGGGVDGAIHRSGGPSILEECKEIRKRQGGCKTGDAVVTNAGNLPANKVIHTVGPVYIDGKNNEPKLLENCYTNSLSLALEHALRSVAFPNISTGIYRYPKQEAGIIAVRTVKDFLKKHPRDFDRIIFVCFDDENYFIYQQLLK